MKPNQIKNGFWKNAVVHFNGFQHKVLDFDGKNKFFTSIKHIIYSFFYYF